MTPDTPKELYKESFFGSWKDLDTEAMKATINNARRASRERIERTIAVLSMNKPKL